MTLAAQIGPTGISSVLSPWKFEIAAVILLGACILGAVNHTRQRDPAE